VTAPEPWFYPQVETGSREESILEDAKWERDDEQEDEDDDPE
jgi:hypothetical protein